MTGKSWFAKKFKCCEKTNKKIVGVKMCPKLSTYSRKVIFFWWFVLSSLRELSCIVVADVNFDFTHLNFWQSVLINLNASSFQIISSKIPDWAKKELCAANLSELLTLGGCFIIFLRVNTTLSILSDIVAKITDFAEPVLFCHKTVCYTLNDIQILKIKTVPVLVNVCNLFREVLFDFLYILSQITCFLLKSIKFVLLSCQKNQTRLPSLIFCNIKSYMLCISTAKKKDDF